MSRGDVFHHLPTLHPSRWLWNVFKINLILCIVFQQNQQRSPFVNSVLNMNPHMMFLLWLTCTPLINKFFLRNFSIYYTLYILIKKVLPGHFNGVALSVAATCCSNSGLTRMQILMNLIRLASSLVICFKNRFEWLSCSLSCVGSGCVLLSFFFRRERINILVFA